MLASLCLVLPACAASTKYVSRAPVLAPPDSALMKECDLPKNLGESALAQAQLERLWITDRRRLLECYRRHLALRDFVIDRDAGVSGGGVSDRGVKS